MPEAETIEEIRNMSTVVEAPPPEFIRNIEWEMMDKSKFFPLSMLSSFSVRCALYPLTLIKTRLQIQKHTDMYSGNRVPRASNGRSNVCLQG